MAGRARQFAGRLGAVRAMGLQRRTIAASAPGKQSTTDIATLFVTGNHFTRRPTPMGGDADQGRRHTKGVVSWYKPDLLGGNHEFKAGVDHLWTWFDDGLPWPRQPGSATSCGSTTACRSRSPRRTRRSKGRTTSNYLGVYGQDSWTLARRLTLNLGLRVEHDTAYAPAQCREAAPFAAAQCWDEIRLVTFNSVAPRVHVAFDIMGDGKTVIKGGYGRFNQLRELMPDLTSINPNVDRDDDLGLARQQRQQAVRPRRGQPRSERAGLPVDRGHHASASVNPNEKQPKTDEFSLTFERELVANTAVRGDRASIRATSIHTRCPRSAATGSTPFRSRISIRGPMAGSARPTIRASRSPTTSIPPSLGGAAFAKTMFVNNPAADANYKTFEIAVTKRPAQGWQLGASYTSTWVGRPDHVRHLGLGARQRDAVGLVPPVPHESQRGLQHGQQDAGVAGQDVGCVQPAVRDSGVGELRYPERGAAGSAGALYRRPTIRSIALNVEPHRHLLPPQHP